MGVHVVLTLGSTVSKNNFLKEVTFVNFALADFCQFCIFVNFALSPRCISIVQYSADTR